jgi:hypothetical protein
MKLILLLSAALAAPIVDVCQPNDQLSELVRKMNHWRTGPEGDDCREKIKSNVACIGTETSEQQNSKRMQNEKYSNDPQVSTDFQAVFKAQGKACQKLTNSIAARVCNSKQLKKQLSKNVEYWKIYTDNDKLKKDKELKNCEDLLAKCKK